MWGGVRVWGMDVSLNDDTSTQAWIPNSAHKCLTVRQVVLVGVL